MPGRYPPLQRKIRPRPKVAGPLSGSIERRRPSRGPVPLGWKRHPVRRVRKSVRKTRPQPQLNFAGGPVEQAQERIGGTPLDPEVPGSESDSVS